MEEQGFRLYLKRSGKREHVVDGLVWQVREFEAYLARRQTGGLDDADRAVILEYGKTLAAGQIREAMRALALYFKFAGNDALTKLASDIREGEIARTRRAFKLRDFRGVNQEEVARLEAAGISDVQQMLAAGRTAEDRTRLAERTGASPESILELVKLSDLSRLGAIKSVRARLYYEAGLDTPDKFRRWEPEALRQMLVDFVERTGFEGIAPLPKELQNAIVAARRLRPAVEY
jgi:hypothetical protein